MDRFNAGNPFNHITRLNTARQVPALYLLIGNNDFPDLIEVWAVSQSAPRALLRHHTQLDATCGRRS